MMHLCCDGCLDLYGTPSCNRVINSFALRHMNIITESFATQNNRSADLVRECWSLRVPLMRMIEIT